MRCQYCGNNISLIRKFKDTEFCSAEHRELFQEEQTSLALARLVEAKPHPSKPLKPAASAADLRAAAAETARQQAARVEALVPQDVAGFIDEPLAPPHPAPPESHAGGPELPPPSLCHPVFTPPAAEVLWEPLGYCLAGGHLAGAGRGSVLDVASLKPEKFREPEPRLELPYSRRTPIFREAPIAKGPALASMQPLSFGPRPHPSAVAQSNLSSPAAGAAPSGASPGPASSAQAGSSIVLPSNQLMVVVVPGSPFAGTPTPASRCLEGAVTFRPQMVWKEPLDSCLRVIPPEPKPESLPHEIGPLFRYLIPPFVPRQATLGLVGQAAPSLGCTRAFLPLTNGSLSLARIGWGSSHDIPLPLRGPKPAALIGESTPIASPTAPSVTLPDCPSASSELQLETAGMACVGVQPPRADLGVDSSPLPSGVAPLAALPAPSAALPSCRMEFSRPLLGAASLAAVNPPELMLRAADPAVDASPLSNGVAPLAALPASSATLPSCQTEFSRPLLEAASLVAVNPPELMLRVDSSPLPSGVVPLAALPASSATLPSCQTEFSRPLLGAASLAAVTRQS